MSHLVREPKKIHLSLPGMLGRRGSAGFHWERT